MLLLADCVAGWDWSSRRLQRSKSKSQKNKRKPKVVKLSLSFSSSSSNLCSLWQQTPAEPAKPLECVCLCDGIVWKQPSRGNAAPTPVLPHTPYALTHSAERERPSPSSCVGVKPCEAFGQADKEVLRQCKHTGPKHGMHREGVVYIHWTRPAPPARLTHVIIHGYPSSGTLVFTVPMATRCCLTANGISVAMETGWKQEPIWKESVGPLVFQDWNDKSAANKHPERVRRDGGLPPATQVTQVKYPCWHFAHFSNWEEGLVVRGSGGQDTVEQQICFYIPRSSPAPSASPGKEEFSLIGPPAVSDA